MEYRETITQKIEGVGFYSPSGHFSEVHLLLEPAERGSGLIFENKISNGILDKKWQKQIMAALTSKKHIGVLTGSPITDMKITLISGSQQKKYSHAGDYREAAVRAVRQGLMKLKAKNAVMLLSPWHKIEIRVDEQKYGQVTALLGKKQGKILEVNPSLTDKMRIKAEISGEQLTHFEEQLILLTKNNYQLKKLSTEFHQSKNQDQITNNIGYDALHDLNNSPNAISCPHASDELVVPWNKVEKIVFYPMSKI